MHKNGKWARQIIGWQDDEGKAANDKVYFPLSDDWRRGEIREADCTERIEKLLNELT